MPDFIPRRDTTAVTWGTTFTQRVYSNYQTYGFSLQDAEQLVALQTQFADAVQAAVSPSTRTTPAVSGKKAARKAFERQARGMAHVIRANRQISRATQIELGLIIGPGRDAPRRRIGPPTSAPLVRIRDVTGSRVSIALKNTDWPSRSGIAPDIHSAMVYARVGDQPPASIGAWSIRRGTPTTRLIVDVGSTNPPGTKVWLAAQWFNARVQAGPVSSPVFTYLGHVSVAPKLMAA